MAEVASKKEPGSGKRLTFKCKFCGKEKPLEEMKTLKRFSPPLTVCKECERKLR